MFFTKCKLPINKQLERYAWFWGSPYCSIPRGSGPILSGSRVSYKISRSDMEMQFVWPLNTFFQAPSIVGKPCKRTWPSEACNTLLKAGSSYTVIFHKVCMDLINLSQLLLNYVRTSLQVAVDHLDRFTW